MWKYFEKNVGSDNVVAVFTNTHGRQILYVYETRTHFIAEPCVYNNFIKPIAISYSVTHDEEAERDFSSSHDVLVNRLKVACKLIEEQYDEQIFHIRSMIG